MTAAKIHLFDLPHDEARRLLAGGAPVYLFVNPVEYHGPHLPLHNDRLISHGLAADLAAARHEPLIVAEDLELGVEPTPGPGSRHTPFETARDEIARACRALIELGARAVILMTFHGAPLHALALEAGVEACRALGVPAVSPLNLLLQEMLSTESTERYADAVAFVDDAGERRRLLDGLRTDFHAGFFETSLTLHYAPDSVAPSYRQVPDCPAYPPVVALQWAARAARLAGQAQLAHELDFAAVARGWQELRPFPGYTSSPRHASPQAGAVFARLILERYLPIVDEVLGGRGRSPLPIMRWVGALHAVGLGAPRHN